MNKSKRIAYIGSRLHMKSVVSEILKLRESDTLGQAPSESIADTKLIEKAKRSNAIGSSVNAGDRRMSGSKSVQDHTLPVCHLRLTFVRVSA